MAVVTLKVMLEHLEKAKAFSLQTAPRECDSYASLLARFDSIGLTFIGRGDCQAFMSVTLKVTVEGALVANLSDSSRLGMVPTEAFHLPGRYSAFLNLRAKDRLVSTHTTLSGNVSPEK